MGKKREKLPREFGEMFVSMRLDEGLIDSGDHEYIRMIGSNTQEMTLTVNDFAREIGHTMLPYLATHPDVGFEGFRVDVRQFAKLGTVFSYKGTVNGKYPFRNIIEETDKVWELFGKKWSSIMVAYLDLSKDQTIQMLQYAHLRIHMNMRFGVNRININIAFREKEDGNNETGMIHIWFA